MCVCVCVPVCVCTRVCVFVCVCVVYPYHVDKLGDGEAKLDNYHIGGVLDWAGPLVVANEQPLKELILRMGVSPLITEH